MNDQKVSKFISYVLRHKPEDIGLEMDDSGWVDVGELIEKSASAKYCFSMDDLVRIVQEDSKNRYSFSDDLKKIRANQGHSKTVNPDLKEAIPPGILYHGTPSVNQASIIANGINKGSRTHVHLSSDIDTAESVAKRRGTPIIFEVDTRSMLNSGSKFYVSSNGVWLVDFVDRQFIQLIDNE